MPEHPLSRSTHTLDMAQIAEIDARLAVPGTAPVTAADLAVDDDRVPATSVLTRAWWEGSPEFPYIYGDFDTAPGVAVPLHTPNLLLLSHRLGLHHRWGV